MSGEYELAKSRSFSTIEYKLRRKRKFGEMQRPQHVKSTTTRRREGNGKSVKSR